MDERIASNHEPPPHHGSVVFVSCGRGRGHAMPDMAIAQELRKRISNIEMQFVSYGAGAEAYRACGVPVIDTRTGEIAPFLDMVVAFTRLFHRMRPQPQLIIAHEEFPILSAGQNPVCG